MTDALKVLETLPGPVREELDCTNDSFTRKHVEGKITAYKVALKRLKEL